MDVLEERLHDLAGQLGATTPEPHAVLARQAGRVRRRRWMTRAGAGTLALVVIAAIVVTARHDDLTRRVETPRTPAPPTTHTQLGVSNGYDSLVLYDLDAGTHQTITLPGKTPGDYPYQLLRVGDWLVYPGNGVQAIRADFSGSPVTLGQASLFVPSAREGWVWLVTLQGTGPYTDSVQEVRVDGTEQGPIYQLPEGMFARVGVPGGLLVGDNTSVAKWDEATGELGASLFDGSSGLVDVRGNTVAWAIDCRLDSTCASLRVLDLATGSSRDIAAPTGTSGWIPTAGEGSRDALSADGRYLALRAGGPVPSGANHPDTSTAYVIDLDDNQTRPVPQSTSDNAFSRVAWSPDGQWVFYETTDHHIGAYRPDDRQATTYPGACCGVALFTIPTAVPTPSTTSQAAATTTSPTASPVAPAASSLVGAGSLAATPDGSVLVATGNRILRRSTDGSVVPFAGAVEAGSSGDGGPALDARFNRPASLAVASDGTVLIADSGNNAIRRIEPDGTVNTVAHLSNPGSVALAADGTIYVVDQVGVEAIDHAGKIRTVPTPNRIDFNGTAIAFSPATVAVDGHGQLVVADLGVKALAIFTTDGQLVHNFGPNVYVTFGSGLATGPDGVVVAALWGGQLVRVVGDQLVPLADGYRFNGVTVDHNGVIYASIDGQSGWRGPAGVYTIAATGTVTLLTS
jgi:sugar lactone lactonase YvrE